MSETDKARIQYRCGANRQVINYTPKNKGSDFSAIVAQNSDPHVCHDRASFLSGNSIHQIRHQRRTDTLVQLRNTGNTQRDFAQC